MGIVHFLNVREGDCAWIEHPSGHNTVIDVSCASKDEQRSLESFAVRSGGNHNQKNYPVNPIEYLNKFSVCDIFRFILTHPDMDHMDGIKDLFSSFTVYNFWDTNNDKQMDDSSDWGNYNEEDWEFYQMIRTSENSPKTLFLYSKAMGKYYNQDESGKNGGDGLYILAPTKELLKEANESGEYNDASYVLLYRTGNNKKIIFGGDSAEKTWDYILEKHKSDVSDIDVLLAPHHGRKTGGNNDYLDILKPKLTLFGNAKSKYLDYASWSRRELEYITNNQANCIILDTSSGEIDVYVTYEVFAKKYNPSSTYSPEHQAWYIGRV